MPVPAVVTGIGVVSPNGVTVPAFVEALRAGASGVRKITDFDTSMLQTKSAGVVVGFDPHAHMSVPDVRRTPRMVPFAVAAAREAMAMAGVMIAEGDVEAARKIGVALGSGGGGLAFVEHQYRLYFTGQRGYSPFTIVADARKSFERTFNPTRLARAEPCAFDRVRELTDAIGHAVMQIRAGVVPMMIAGGADAPIAEGILRGFELMRILAAERDPPTEMSRPFAKDRDGFVLGEGAWMFVIESAEHARGRGARVLAEVLGYGSTCDAYHRVQPSPDAGECVRAIEIALAEGRVGRDQIDYVNLHGTGTQLNDTLETRAMHLALGERAGAVPMSATKSMIGHPQGACGAAGLAATILSLRAGFVHPTINLRERDEACDLDYVANETREFAIGERGRVALCNCIAFGSKNSALVVRVLGA